MICPGSNTDRWAKGWPLLDHTGQAVLKDVGYETAQCWDCLGRFELRWAPALIGRKQVLVDHEPKEKPGPPPDSGSPAPAPAPTAPRSLGTKP